MSKTYSFVFNKTGIYLNLREWEGIGTPDYTTLAHIPIHTAKTMLTDLGEAIQKAEVYEAERISRREKDLEQEIKQKQSELDAIRKGKLYEQNKKSGIEPYFEDYTPV